jgi:excisionase family DNA binding protein
LYQEEIVIPKTCQGYPWHVFLFPERTLMIMPTAKYMNVQQTANYLGCSVRTVERMMKRKMFPYRKVGRRIFIDPNEVEKGMEKHKRT